ncbi:MAG: acetyl-CoA hydrolase/transferase C-terminal domain-containing protein [Pseudomonadota bacterium]
MGASNGRERHPQSLDDVVSWTISRVGKRLVLATPLGLGKPNALLNAFYSRAKSDPEISLEILTALNLVPPLGGNDVEKRFIRPFSSRFFGDDYPRLDYADDQLAGRLPSNVQITEFYFQSGSRLGNEHAQRHYISANYTHVARDAMDRGVNVMVQMVSAGEVDGQPMLSLSSNPDVTLDMAHRLTFQPDYPLLKIAQVHEDYPFLHGDAVVPYDFFDVIVEPPAKHTLFALPRAPVETQDFCVGLHASALVGDAGTLQIGIGSLSDALVHALILRHHDNDRYRNLLVEAGTERTPGIIDKLGGREPFNEGLFGASEMFLDGFMHLYKAGILKRRVHDDIVLQELANKQELPEKADALLIEAMWDGGSLPPALDDEELARLQDLGVLARGVALVHGRIEAPDGSTIENDLLRASNRGLLAEHCLAERLSIGTLMEGAFYLGTKNFYGWLNALSEEERPQFRMSSVRRINQLYGGSETLEILQRKKARFINSCMMMSVTGAAISDALAGHRLVSGVGGQYNFVAMAHALHEGRSILMLRSRRESASGPQSNVVWEYPHTTIPRHLRDIVVTEYGIADLRSRTDEDCIMAMVEVSDRAFQDELVAQAKAGGKLRNDYVVPDAARQNTPERLEAMLKPYRADGLFEDFPFGSDFDEVEQRLVPALKRLKALAASKPRLFATALKGKPADYPEELARMGLERPSGFAEQVLARVLAVCLAESQT